MNARYWANRIADLRDAGVNDALIGPALIASSLDDLARNVRRIAEGENNPGGLEGLAMAISGEGAPSTSRCLATAVGEVADRLGDIAEKLDG